MASKSKSQNQETQSHKPSSAAPYRQIRASYDSETITVYQAYSSEIAIAAVAQQRLNASAAFSMTRMTWIKPSWAWMLYRSGYSYKDSRQTHILALKVKHSTFLNLLRHAVLSHGGNTTKSEGRVKSTNVVVQWDPERTVRLEKLPYRSIQVGIPGTLVQEFIEGIVQIEDVSGRARELKRLVDAKDEESMGWEGLVPIEKEYEVEGKIRAVLGMDDA